MSIFSFFFSRDSIFKPDVKDAVHSYLSVFLCFRGRCYISCSFNLQHFDLSFDFFFFNNLISSDINELS